MDDKPIPLIPDTARVADLRARVRAAMEREAVPWEGPARIDARYIDEPLAVRKARAIALKLSHMPTDLWAGQLFAGSMTLEEPRLHYERTFPDYLTEEERQAATQEGLSIRSVFGHIVPDYPTLVAVGLSGIRAEAEAQQPLAENESDRENARSVAFLRSVILSLDAVMDYAARLAAHCEAEAERHENEQRAEELWQMAANLRQAPAGPALTFWQALQSVWLLHLVFHSTLNGNAVGRLDQFAWPLLEADLAAGRLDLARAGELVDCFCLKFNERAQTNEEQLAGSRPDEGDKIRRTRHTLSSQVRSHDANVGPKTWLQNQPVYDRDRVDATNHWLQNIVVSGLTPEGEDGTNPLS
ncbi:MAG: pyruvate formate lyase family protein, partial [Anaerolineae bacterium]